MSNKKNILFRADSSQSIGTGHIMRDLVLASQYPKDSIIFATQELEKNINHKIIEAGYRLEILNSNSIKEVLELIKKYQIDMIVIDHYDIDENYEKELKIQNPTLKVMVLDDTYQRHYCDILLNHNIYAKEKEYKNLVPDFCTLKCGSRYTLIRDEFLNIVKTKRGIKEKKRVKIFVSLGGSDSQNITQKVLNTLSQIENLDILVVTSSANPNIKTLREYCEKSDNIKLFIDTKEMAKLLNESDIAIISPSVTAHEVMVMEVAFISIKTASNQRFMHKYLTDEGLFALEKFEKERLKSFVLKLLNHTYYDRYLAKMAFSKEVTLINFIDLTLQEKKMVLKWRNHQNIRRWMYNSQKITLEEHLAYIDSLRDKDDRKYFLLKNQKEYLGVIDFTNISKNQADFGLYANPNLKGVGSRLMNSLISYAFKSLKLKRLVAEVFEDNKKAYALYQKFNFKNIGQKMVNNQNIICMELRDENS